VTTELAARIDRKTAAPWKTATHPGDTNSPAQSIVRSASTLTADPERCSATMRPSFTATSAL